MSYDAELRRPGEPEKAARQNAESVRPVAAGAGWHALRLQRAAGNRAAAAALQRMLRRPGAVKTRDERKEDPPEKSVTATRERVIAKGEHVFHGTRWTAGEEKWWATPDNFPNKVGADGGVSFALDARASPKTRQPGIVPLDYEVTQEIRAVHCASKGEF